MTGNKLPQLEGELFMTDGGIETTLIFLEGLDLPDFAAFHLAADARGREALKTYYRRHAQIAARHGTGFIYESATWRASRDWAERLGYSAAELADANRDAVALMKEVRDEIGVPHSRTVISGCVGPRGDGYNPEFLMKAEQAEIYHGEQIASLNDAGVDMITAITMTYVAEAVGITRAAQARGLPVVISYTVETDGRLPTGEALGQAIERTDALTGNGPAYYMINCAHPDHFDGALAAGESWVRRIRGIRANASRMSHAELDNAEKLDDGDPAELGDQYRAMVRRLPQLNVLGGCCGTDHRHIEAVARACVLDRAA